MGCNQSSQNISKKQEDDPEQLPNSNVTNDNANFGSIPIDTAQGNNAMTNEIDVNTSENNHFNKDKAKENDTDNKEDNTISNLQKSVVITKQNQPPMLQGFLTKQGRSSIKSWKNRYFVLLNGELKYYEAPLNEKPYGYNLKGGLDLKYYCINDDIPEDIPAPYSAYNIYLTPVKLSSGVDVETEHHHLLLSCENIEVYSSWMAALDAHIQYYKQIE